MRVECQAMSRMRTQVSLRSPKHGHSPRGLKTSQRGVANIGANVFLCKAIFLGFTVGVGPFSSGKEQSLIVCTVTLVFETTHIIPVTYGN